MSLLYKIVFNSKATSTHHKLALDALRHLNDSNADKWFKLFLKHHDNYLKGAKAPDKTFHDFKNHVLHVQENYWGGAPVAAKEWYQKLVTALKNKDWKEAVYNAGVLSHYVTDPVQPLHTGQTEEEGLIHKVVEWGTSKIFNELAVTYPDITLPSGNDWLTELIKQGATKSNQYYFDTIEHYDYNKGRKKPAKGFDDVLKGEFSELIGYAVISFSLVLDKAFEDASVDPPNTNLTLSTLLRIMSIPKYWITRKLVDKKEKAIIDAMYKEFDEKGKVIEALPADDKEVRRLHAKEVLKIPLKELDKKPLTMKTRTTTVIAKEKKPSKKEKRSIVAKERKKTEKKPSKVEKLKFYLELTDPVDDAPEIGPKTAKRLQTIGIITVKDLLDRDPKKIAEQLKHRSITEKTIIRWQQEARLAYQIPKIRGHDVQLLVASGLTDPEKISKMKPEELLDRVMVVVKSPKGEKILRSSNEPDLKEVNDWINWANKARK